MITLFARDTVPDYDTWHKVFEDFAPVLKDKGVIGSAVYRSLDNPNDVTVAHDFATLAAAQAFADSDELRAARRKLKMTGSPAMWFATKE